MTEIVKCSCCNEYPVVKCDNIWINGEQVWYCKIYCNKMCDKQVSAEDKSLFKAINLAVSMWNK